MFRRFGGPGIHGIGGVPLSSLGGGALKSYADRVMGYQPIAYWPLWETTGTVAQCLTNSAMNGTYNSDVSGWPPGVGIGDGNTAPYFDGTNDNVDVYSVTLRAALNSNEGTVILWVKMANAGIWTDGAPRLCLYFYVPGEDDVIQVDKSNVNNTFRGVYTGNTVQDAVSAIIGIAVGSSWFHVALTWSQAADQIEMFINGISQGTSPGLTLWNELLSGALIGSYIGPIMAHNGNIGHCALFNRVLLQPVIAALAVV